MPMPTYTLEELESIFGRMDPEKLFFIRSGLDLGPEIVDSLIRKIALSYDPASRLQNLEYLLLVLHEARATDQEKFLIEVYLPWVSIQRSMKNQMIRISEDFARLSELDAYSESDTAHIATKIYRPLVADVLDPHLSLVMASYQFKEGKYVNIYETDVGLGERSKAEYLAARIKAGGGPTAFLSGYDPIVRNALSHGGSSGVVYEKNSVLFRNIKRQVPPIVTTRRWTHDELHTNVLKLLEVCMAIDAAVEIFGIDCAEILSQPEMFQHVAFFALDKAARLSIRAEGNRLLEPIRSSEELNDKERLDLLGKIVFAECAKRSMPCTSIGFGMEHKAVSVQVPVDVVATTDTEIQDQAIRLIRYSLVARAVLGSLFERYQVVAKYGDLHSITVETPYQSLVEYDAEEAGLIDLLSDAKIFTNDGTVSIAIASAPPRKGRLSRRQARRYLWRLPQLLCDLRPSKQPPFLC